MTAGLLSIRMCGFWSTALCKPLLRSGGSCGLTPGLRQPYGFSCGQRAGASIRQFQHLRSYKVLPRVSPCQSRQSVVDKVGGALRLLGFFLYLSCGRWQNETHIDETQRWSSSCTLQRPDSSVACCAVPKWPSAPAPYGGGARHAFALLTFPYRSGPWSPQGARRQGPRGPTLRLEKGVQCEKGVVETLLMGAVAAAVPLRATRPADT